MNAKQWLKQLTEKGARNNANDATMIQTMHDHSVALGASCGVSEAADFSNSDVMVLLDAAVRKTFKNEYNYPRVCDLYDDYLVFSSDYSSATCYKVDYSVSESGSVTLGTPVAVVRKVTYIEPNIATTESDSSETDLNSDSVSLIEVDDNEIELIEAKTRVVKLIAPGWGSSGYYPADVLKRDGPNVFKAGLHNYVDHLTADEEKRKPEGFVERLASVLTEDAKWQDDYKGHGPGLYAKAKVNDVFNTFLNDFGSDIGMSIRAMGKTKIGTIDGKNGPIVESITTAKSVDYVTAAGAGGKILELFENARKNVDIKEVKEKEVTTMATDQEFTALQETVNKLVTQNARLAESLTMRDAREYAVRKLANPSIRLHTATKDRILDGLVVSAPLTETGVIDYKAFDALIETAVTNEASYLSSVGAFGSIKGFGQTQPFDTKPFDPDKAFGELQESLRSLDDFNTSIR